MPSPQAERIVARQTGALRRQGASGRQILRDIDSYVAGVNAYFRSTGQKVQTYTRNDVYAAIAIVGQIFGRGGGDEARRSELLDALRKRLGARRGLALFDNLRQQQDPEATTTSAGASRTGPGAVPAAGTSCSTPAASTGAEPRRQAGNFLVVGRQRSRTGHPLFVAGPQIDYYYPGLTFELDVYGGVTAGVLKAGGGEPERTLRYRTTVHGPVIGYGGVRGPARRGLPAALEPQPRRALGRGLPPPLDRGRPQRRELRPGHGDVALHVQRRLRRRSRLRHVLGRVPARAGAGRGQRAADEGHGRQRVARVLNRTLAQRRRHTLATVTGAMNVAATQDFRVVRLWPIVDAVLSRRGPAPSARVQAMRRLLDAWRARGGSRLDRTGDAKIDDPAPRSSTPPGSASPTP